MADLSDILEVCYASAAPLSSSRLCKWMHCVQAKRNVELLEQLRCFLPDKSNAEKEWARLVSFIARFWQKAHVCSGTNMKEIY